MSAPFETWFQAFAKRHIARFPTRPISSPWPDRGTIFWKHFREILVDDIVSEADADTASEELARRGLPFFDKHHSEFIKCVTFIRSKSKVASTGAPESRADAESQSRNCPDCKGLGLAVRFRHRSPGPPVNFACLCPYGRWLAGRGHTPDLALHSDFQLGRVAWSDEPDHRLRYPTSAWDFDAERPTPAPSVQAYLMKKPLKLAESVA